MNASFQPANAQSLPATNWFLVTVILAASVLGALLATGLLFMLIRKTIKKDVDAWQPPVVIPTPTRSVPPVGRPNPVPADPVTTPNTTPPTGRPAPAPVTTTDNPVDTHTPSTQPEGPAQEDEQTPD